MKVCSSHYQLQSGLRSCAFECHSENLTLKGTQKTEIQKTLITVKHSYRYSAFEPSWQHLHDMPKYKNKDPTVADSAFNEISSHQ